MEKLEKRGNIRRFLRHPIREIKFRRWKREMESDKPAIRGEVGNKLLEAVNNEWNISGIEGDIKKYIDDDNIENKHGLVQGALGRINAVKALVRHHAYNHENAEDALLKHPEKELRDAAVGELIESYGTSTERVIELLEHENAEIRRRMANKIIERNKRCLFRNEKQEIISVLEKNAFSDPDEKVRYTSMMAVGVCYFNDTCYLNGGREKLLELIRHPDMFVRRGIAYALKEMADERGFERAVEILEGNTDDRTPLVEIVKVSTLANVYYLTENHRKLHELTDDYDPDSE